MKRTVLIDRDGTIIEECNYLNDPDKVRLIPRAVEGLLCLASSGFGLVVISNQSGVARGLISPEQLGAVNARIEELLRQEGISLDGIYCCLHGPWEGCSCRKPAPGLAREAAEELGFLPHECFVIGDKFSDVGLAGNIGAKGILVRTGYGRETEKDCPAIWDFAVEDLLEAAHFIVEETRCKGEES